VLQEAIDSEPADPAAPRDETSVRIVEGALRQFEEFGLRRTTMEDVARRVGVSRVTIYRRFSGKEALVEAVIMDEAQAFFRELDEAVADCHTTDELLVQGFAFALQQVRGHVLVNRLLTTEPESLLPHLTRDAGPVVAAARTFLAERLAREFEGSAVRAGDLVIGAELLVRLVLSFLLTPESVVALETAEDARTFARRYLAPALHSVADNA
jgi:AcrR family transcriptional regulator